MKATIVCLVACALTGCSAGTPASISTDASTAPASSTRGTTVPTTAVSSPDVTTTSLVDWPGPCGHPSGAAPPSYDHVIWIWMENKNLDAVLDSSSAPFLRSLAESFGTAVRYVDHGIHPSLPNYLAATSGGTQGVADDSSKWQNHRLLRFGLGKND